MADWVRVAGLDDYTDGQPLGVRVNGNELVLARVDGSFYCLEDRCSHQDYPLSDGDLDGDRLECIYHGAQFDMCTGEAKQLPAIKPVKSFNVEVRGEDIYVEIPTD